MKRTESGRRCARRRTKPSCRRLSAAAARGPPAGASFPPAPPGGPSDSIRSVESAFYEPAGQDSYVATAATVGPWAADAQHGGPPSALAARALERHEPDVRQRLAKVAVDILRPVPVGKLSIRTRTIRPGRRVTLVEAIMEADGQEVLHARGWRIERPAGGVPEIADGGPPGPVPAAGDGFPPLIFRREQHGYLASIEWRFDPGRLRRSRRARCHRGGDRRHRRSGRGARADHGSACEHRAGQGGVDTPADPAAA